MFLSRLLHRITAMLVQSFFCMFWHFKVTVETQNRPFLTILACCSFCKMTNFATFQNLVVLSILNVLFLAICVESHFLYDFHSLKFNPKVAYF